MSLENGERLQILRYEHGQKYEPHYDTFDKFNQQKAGNRVATVLIYLSNVDKGGETVFPGSEVSFLDTVMLSMFFVTSPYELTSKSTLLIGKRFSTKG